MLHIHRPVSFRGNSLAIFFGWCPFVYKLPFENVDHCTTDRIHSNWSFPIDTMAAMVMMSVAQVNDVDDVAYYVDADYAMDIGYYVLVYMASVDFWHKHCCMDRNLCDCLNHSMQLCTNI